eukprot:CAMPEP_0197233872 /NCGR_PEP_ID=MMETSP1429-20130617/1807_1 /TAXON_ID=49237 /ORGANISM="Chaetoceros  sp., Strain UNC1202" /LENGTH=260 /DNA_ID=CAMNT_0042692189 /DNA_START=8 /DNA_END=787 /DNA_ORIENTATION=-
MTYEKQTLVNASCFQTVNGTALTFAKPLNDGDEVVPPRGDVTFIWALGNDNSLTGHQQSGSVTLEIAPCTLFDEFTVRKNKFRDAIILHAFLGCVAFAILIPIPFVASAFRKFIDFELCGTKGWIVIHAGCSLLSVLFVAALLTWIILLKNGLKRPHFQHTHEIVGIILCAVFALQIVAGIARPRPPKIETDDDHKDDGFDEERIEMAVSRKSYARTAWEISHKITGVAIIVTAMFQIKSGINLYESYFGEDTNWQIRYW